MGILEWLLSSETKSDLERRQQQDSIIRLQCQQKALTEMLNVSAEMWKVEAQDRRASHKIDLGWAGNVPIGHAQTAETGEAR